MATGRTNLLDLPLPTQGELDGTWGNTVNNGLTEYLDIAIAGRTALTSANFTAGALTIATTEGDAAATNIVAGSAQYATLYTSSLATNSTITAPSSNRAYRVINADSTYTLTVKASGQTGVTFQPGQSGLIAYNGTDYQIIGLSFATPLTVTGNSSGGAEIRLPEDTDNGSEYVAWKAPSALGTSLTFTLPFSDGSSGQTWTTNGSGVLSFGTLGVIGGGTGQSSYTDGQLLIGNSTGNTLTKANLTGTSNQITVTNGSGSITLATPQNIGTSSSVQFGSFGVGTAASGTTGEIRATNNVTAYYSDDRLKTKLGSISGALDKVRSLQAFYYHANETAQSLGYEQVKEVGLSAHVCPTGSVCITGSSGSSTYRRKIFDDTL